MIHICTHESHLHDAIVCEHRCHICDEVAIQRYGYVVGHCSFCNQYYDLEGWMGYTVRLRRTALKMSRRDFAKLLGIKRKSLANCETSHCSTRVYKKSLEIFKSLFTKDVLKDRLHAS